MWNINALCFINLFEFGSSQSMSLSQWQIQNKMETRQETMWDQPNYDSNT